jgi:hypothetical protein
MAVCLLLTDSKGRAPGKRRVRMSRLGGWPKEAAVFAIELAGAFVSDLKSRTGGVHTIHEHQFPRGMQLKLLLIVKVPVPQRCRIVSSEEQSSDSRHFFHCSSACEAMPNSRLRPPEEEGSLSVWLSVPLCRVGSGSRRDSTRKQMTGLEAGGVFENAFHSPSERARIGTRSLLKRVSGKS